MDLRLFFRLGTPHSGRGRRLPTYQQRDMRGDDAPLARRRGQVFALEGGHVFSRYISFVQQGGRALFVMKDHVTETAIQAWSANRFRALRIAERMQHNIAFAPINDSHFMAVGGQYLHGSRTDLGIAQSFSRDMLQWTAPVTVLLGTHEGCIECRPSWNSFRKRNFDGMCEFDGRLSLVTFREELWLFTRANTGVGGREVQVTKSMDGGASWGEFRPVQLDLDGKNIYFFGVSPHPTVDDALLSVFPYVEGERGLVMAAVSTDAVHWRQIGAIAVGGTVEGRSLIHPAIGVALVGRTVHAFVHENVHYETRNYLTLAHHGLRQVLDRRFHSVLDRAFAPFMEPSRIARYAIDARDLSERTYAALNDTSSFHIPRCGERDRTTYTVDARPILLIGVGATGTLLLLCALIRLCASSARRGYRRLRSQ